MFVLVATAACKITPTFERDLCRQTTLYPMDDDPPAGCLAIVMDAMRPIIPASAAL